MKFLGDVKIIEKSFLNDEVFRFRIERPKEVTALKAGQFFNIKTNNYGSPLLRRPISVSDFDDESIEFTVKILGNGTSQLSLIGEGDTVDMMGPLGNGYEYKGNRVLLIGGGIGIAPIKGLMLSLIKENPDIIIDVILGFRDEPYLKEVFKSNSDNCIIVSENDEKYTKGFVTEPLKTMIKNEYDMIYTCGPLQMLKAVTSMCNDVAQPVQVLMEEKMACGIGACLVCTCKVKADEFGFKHVRMCKEGPMFYGSEVIFDA